MTVNHMAADSKEGLGQVYYSAKYSEITKELLNNWLENREKSVTYAEEYQKIVAKMGGNAKIVVGVTDIRISLKSMKLTEIQMMNTSCTNIWLKPMANIFPMNGQISIFSYLSRLSSSATSADGMAELWAIR